MNTAKKYPEVDIDKRWFMEKLREFDLSQSDLARQLEVDRSVVSLILSGKRRLHPEEAHVIASAFHATVPEVLAHAGLLPATRASMRLWGVADRDGIVSPAAAGEVIARPPEQVGDAVAIQCRASNGDLAMFDGWVFFVGAGEGVAPGALGKLCLVKKAKFKGRGQLSFCERGYKSGRFNLVSLVKNKVETDVELEFARPVVLIRP